MRAPSFRGRFSRYKHVRRAGRTVKECCLHRAGQPAPYIPKTSAGRFRPNLPITLRPRQALRSPEAPVSRFESSNVWQLKRECCRRGWHCAPAATTASGLIPAIFGRKVCVTGEIGERTGVASDPPGWTCVLYLRCQSECRTRHFGGQP